ncbi:MAG TPA: HEAT repeat domain-containing protein, partial [Armatimonadota bacterium]|nr:HEAT repeat domain-containing protein [Armatimonadota bacterium]
VVAPILATLASAEDPRTRGACMVALEALKGPGPGKALVAAYPGLTGQAQVAMIAMFGRKGGAAVLPAILEAARSEEAELRQTALRALGICAEPGGVPVLAQAAVSGPDEERPLAVDALARAAQTLRERGRTDDAGRAYGALYEAAPTPELRQTALDGIIACPVAEAFDIVFRVGGELEPSALSPPAQIAMLGALAKVGRKGEAMELLDALTNQPLVGDGVAQLAASLAPLAGDMNVPQRLGFVTDWRVVGPFPFGGPGSGLDEEHVGEPKVDLAARYQVGDAEVAWQEVHSRDLAGIVSLHDVFGMVERRVCYAYTRIDVPEGGDAILRCGSDDGIKAWVNGEVVLNHDVDRGAQVDQDQAPCTLRAGTNELLVKISQGGGGWNFCLRFTTPDGRPLVSSPAR